MATIGSYHGLTRAEDDDIERVLFSAEAIAARVQELGAQIGRDYDGRRPLIVGIITGACVFTADLIRCIPVPLEVDFMSVSSYGHGTESSGSVKIRKDLNIDPAGRHIIFVEDVVDSGLTLKSLGALMSGRGAASVAYCCLFDKKARRVHTIPALAYVGFPCPDEFIVGYGIDYAERYRSLPYVGAVKRSVYEKK